LSHNAPADYNFNVIKYEAGVARDRGPKLLSISRLEQVRDFPILSGFPNHANSASTSRIKTNPL